MLRMQHTLYVQTSSKCVLSRVCAGLSGTKQGRVIEATETPSTPTDTRPWLCVAASESLPAGQIFIPEMDRAMVTREGARWQINTPRRQPDLAESLLTGKEPAPGPQAATPGSQSRGAATSNGGASGGGAASKAEPAPVGKKASAFNLAFDKKQKVAAPAAAGAAGPAPAAAPAAAAAASAAASSNGGAASSKAAAAAGVPEPAPSPAAKDKDVPRGSSGGAGRDQDRAQPAATPSVKSAPSSNDVKHTEPVHSNGTVAPAASSSAASSAAAGSTDRSLGPSKPRQQTPEAIHKELQAYLAQNRAAKQIAAALMPGQSASRVPTDPHTLAMEQMLLATGLLEDDDLADVLAAMSG